MKERGVPWHGSERGPRAQMRARSSASPARAACADARAVRAPLPARASKPSSAHAGWRSRRVTAVPAGVDKQASRRKAREVSAVGGFFSAIVWVCFHYRLGHYLCVGVTLVSGARSERTAAGSPASRLLGSQPFSSPADGAKTPGCQWLPRLCHHRKISSAERTALCSAGLSGAGTRRSLRCQRRRASHGRSNRNLRRDPEQAHFGLTSTRGRATVWSVFVECFFSGVQGGTPCTACTASSGRRGCAAATICWKRTRRTPHAGHTGQTPRRGRDGQSTFAICC